MLRMRADGVSACDRLWGLPGAWRSGVWSGAWGPATHYSTIQIKFALPGLLCLPAPGARRDTWRRAVRCFFCSVALCSALALQLHIKQVRTFSSVCSLLFSSAEANFLFFCAVGCCGFFVLCCVVVLCLFE